MRAQPLFHDPPFQKGGFWVGCLSVTDFAKRTEPCAENETGGACDCMNGVLGLPPVVGDQTPGGAVTFPDTSCTATYASACLPRTIPTDSGWEQPPPTHAGQVLIDQLLDPDREPSAESSLRDKAFHWDWGTLPFGYADDISTGETVAEDVNREFQRGCFLAHFSVLAQEYLGVVKDTPQWRVYVSLGLQVERAGDGGSAVITVLQDFDCDGVAEVTELAGEFHRGQPALAGGWRLTRSSFGRIDE